VGAAIYWRSIKWAIEQGFKEFNFMGSNAWESDGVFRTKNKWRPKIVDDPWEHSKLIFAANHLSAEWQDHLNQIGFLTCVGGQYLRVYIDTLSPPDTPADIEAKKEQALKSGLSGIQVVGRGYIGNYFI
jgi:hypothetical protein